LKNRERERGKKKVDKNGKNADNARTTIIFTELVVRGKAAKWVHYKTEITS